MKRILLLPVELALCAVAQSIICATARAQEQHGAARIEALTGSPARADSVAVDSSAADTLAAAYTPHREAAWCIDRWHLERGRGDRWIPVVDAVHFAAWGDSLSIPRPACFIVHTHPPAFPRPSWADIGVAIFERGDPFTIVQSGPHRFAGWVTSRVLRH